MGHAVRRVSGGCRVRGRSANRRVAMPWRCSRRTHTWHVRQWLRSSTPLLVLKLGFVAARTAAYICHTETFLSVQTAGVNGGQLRRDCAHPALMATPWCPPPAPPPPPPAAHGPTLKPMSCAASWGTGSARLCPRYARACGFTACRRRSPLCALGCLRWCGRRAGRVPAGVLARG